MMQLIGVTELTLGGRGPKTGYVFDAHRLAFPCWAALGRGALLVTLDRHYDTVVPKAGISADASLLELEHFAHRSLDVRNYDHVLAAMNTGLLTGALVIARSHPVGSVTSDWVDSHGVTHPLVGAPTVDALSLDFGKGTASPAGQRAFELISRAERIILDVDLDCFTTQSDADPTAIIPWPRELIRQHVLPLESEPFWAAVLGKCVGLTLAREPSHCGGLLAANRLFEDACHVLFRELLHTDVP